MAWQFEILATEELIDTRKVSTCTGDSTAIFWTPQDWQKNEGTGVTVYRPIRAYRFIHLGDSQHGGRRFESEQWSQTEQSTR